MMTDPNNRIAQLEADNSQLRAQLDQIRQSSVEKQVEHERLSGRLEDLLDLLPAGVVVIDSRGRVAECNSAAEQLLGPPLKNETWVSVIQRSFAPRSDDGHEVSLKNGRRVSLSTSTLANESGQLLMLTDQTDTRLLQGRLAHYQRLSEMGRMMASLAHQVRTPLSAALLYAGHLMKPELRPEQRIKFAGKVKSRLENLELQVRDMLIFARGETRLEDRISIGQLFRELEDALDMPLHSRDDESHRINRVPELHLQCNKDSLLRALLHVVNTAKPPSGDGTLFAPQCAARRGQPGLEGRV